MWTSTLIIIALVVAVLIIVNQWCASLSARDAREVSLRGRLDHCKSLLKITEQRCGISLKHAEELTTELNKLHTVATLDATGNGVSLDLTRVGLTKENIKSLWVLTETNGMRIAHTLELPIHSLISATHSTVSRHQIKFSRVRYGNGFTYQLAGITVDIKHLNNGLPDNTERSGA